MEDWLGVVASCLLYWMYAAKQKSIQSQWDYTYPKTAPYSLPSALYLGSLPFCNHVIVAENIQLTHEIPQCTICRLNTSYCYDLRVITLDFLWMKSELKPGWLTAPRVLNHLNLFFQTRFMCQFHTWHHKTHGCPTSGKYQHDTVFVLTLSWSGIKITQTTR